VVLTTAAGAHRLGGNARGLQPWASTQLEAPAKPPIQVTATPCRHGPPLSRPIVGEVIGFALGWEGQAHGKLWITGDTVLYLGCVRFPVTGPVRYSMTVREAVQLCRRVRPRTAIPVHYEGWTHFRQGRGAIEHVFSAAPEDVGRCIRWLPIGASVSIAGYHTSRGPGGRISGRA
jgi:L-ascorbate metabolism protein UlaG (beta-lactamase superfamily)